MTSGGGTGQQRAGALLAVLVLTLAPAAPVGAQTQAVQTLPGCAARTLSDTDDSSTMPVALGFTANFFGKVYTEAYVNQNGNISFEVPLSTFTPFDLGASSVPIIAPFLADVDTSPAASGKTTYGRTTVDGRPAFCVTWTSVGYYDDHTDKLNTFQLLLVSQPGGTGDFDVIFNYDTITWETGDASGGTGGLGGTSAAAGYSNADGNSAHAYVQPGSRVNGAFLDGGGQTALSTQTHDSTQPGRDVFAIRNAPPPPPALGKTVRVETVKGTVLVKLPGSDEYVDLSLTSDIPTGSVLDTTNGVVQLTSAQDSRGHTQTAQFSGSVFKVKQSKKHHGRTDLILRGGSFASCSKKSHRVIRKLRGETGKPKKATIYRATHGQATAAKKKKRARFRTQGKFAAATVRGTIWGTIDRCDGTVTWVKRGTVVVRDLVRKKTLRVRAGHRYLARAKRR